MSQLPKAAQRVFSVAFAAWLVAGCAHTPALRATDALWSRWPQQTVGRVPLSAWPPRNELVLVTFITTWCFPCLAELPVLQTLHEKYASKGLRVVLVGIDREGRRVLEPLAAQYNFPFPLVVADQELASGQSLWGNVGPLPTRVLFGRDGEVLLVANGSGVSPQEWLERVGKEVER